MLLFKILSYFVAYIVMILKKKTKKKILALMIKYALKDSDEHKSERKTKR